MKYPSFLMIFLLTGLFLTWSCTSTSTSKLISIEDYTFARADESGNLNPVASPSTFQKGEKVHLVLLHVGPFKKDSIGLNWLIWTFVFLIRTVLKSFQVNRCLVKTGILLCLKTMLSCPMLLFRRMNQ